MGNDKHNHCAIDRARAGLPRNTAKTPLPAFLKTPERIGFAGRFGVFVIIGKMIGTIESDEQNTR